MYAFRLSYSNQVKQDQHKCQLLQFNNRINFLFYQFTQHYNYYSQVRPSFIIYFTKQYQQFRLNNVTFLKSNYFIYLLMISQSDAQIQRRMVLQMLNEFYGPQNLQPQAIINNQSTPIHLNSVLFLLKSTGNFSPLVLKQIRNNFQKRRVNNSQIYVTKQQLVEELCNPTIQQSWRNSKTVFEFLKDQNNNNRIDMRRMVTNQEHRRLLEQNRMKPQLSVKDIEKIIYKQIVHTLQR